MNYQKINTITGWAVFLIATIVYVLTLEPTTSLWDCGEYIATSYKLEVGHPPGAPLFMMLGRLFSAFADPESVAYMINLMSALCSSFTILFLFWTITAFGKKIATLDGAEFDKGKILAVLGSGIVGGLAYTFSDSFWFSAVEAEVYAMSSLFTAIVFWAILKWEQVADDINADRWLILIMFLMGLSIGVHLLNLLAIPALAFVYYFKKHKTSLKGIILTGVIGVGLLGLIQAVIIPGIVDLGEVFERFFRNSLGAPFYFGMIFYFIFIFGLIAFAVYMAQKKKNEWIYRAAMSLAVLIIGYLCFSMIVVRSNANPPIDENNPEDLVSLSNYLKREQYGSWPIMYGQYYNAALNRENTYKDKSPVYMRRWVVRAVGSETEKGFVEKESADAYAAELGGNPTVVEKYYMVDDGKKGEYNWDPNHSTILPRMWSTNVDKWNGYEYWSNRDNSSGEKIQYLRQLPAQHANQTLPTFGENLTYMFSYQMNWMYFRYFLWNFAGRQNDEQGTRGNPLDGNWMSGISFIDSQHLGDQTNVPDSITSNPSYNKFFLLPLILGLIGFIFHLYRHPKDWSIVMLLFFFTGIAIIMYLNQQPDEPRERDYAYAGSFYTFAIWIGLSVYALYYAAKEMTWAMLGKLATYLFGTGVAIFVVELMGGASHTFSFSIFYISVIISVMASIMIALREKLPNGVTTAGVALLIALPAPILMAVQGWDDHDRSNRYTAKALAHNYLIACEDNGIVFTNGDNDTFPLWYIQEVEGFKTSVRVCNLSLLHSDWYAEQMARKAYDSEALPIKFTKDQYGRGGNLEYVAMQNMPTAYFKEKYEANQDIIKQSFPSFVQYVAQVIQRTPLAQEKPEIVPFILGFNDGEKTYAEFLPFMKNLTASKSVPEQAKKQISEAQAQFHSSWDYLPLDFAMDLLRDEKNMYTDKNGSRFVIPSTKFVIKVDKDAVIKNGVVPEEMRGEIADYMRFDVGRGGLTRSELMALEIINQNSKDWSRPLYFGTRAGKSTYLGLDQYLQMEGLVYRVVPLKPSMERASRYTYGSVNADIMYDNLVNKFIWGNMNVDGVLVDYYNRRQINHYRVQFLILSRTLADKKDFERALQVLDKCFEAMPLSNVPIDYNDMAINQIIATYFVVAAETTDQALKEHAIQQGMELSKIAMERSKQNILYYTTLGDYDKIKRTFNRMKDDFETIDLFYQSSQDAAIKKVLPENYISEVETNRESMKQMILTSLNDMMKFYKENVNDPQSLNGLQKQIVETFGALFQDDAEPTPPATPVSAPQVQDTTSPLP